MERNVIVRLCRLLGEYTNGDFVCFCGENKLGTTHLEEQDLNKLRELELLICGKTFD